jgi:hypothetical protein
MSQRANLHGDIATNHRQLEDLYTLTHEPGHELEYRGYQLIKEPDGQTRRGRYRILDAQNRYQDTVALDVFDSVRDWLWYVDTLIEESADAARAFVLED